MKKNKKFRDHLEADVDDLNQNQIKKKKKIHQGPKKKHFSKHMYDVYGEEE